MDKRLIPTRTAARGSGQPNPRANGAHRSPDDIATISLWIGVATIALVNAFVLVSMLTMNAVAEGVERITNDCCVQNHSAPRSDYLIIGAAGLPILAGLAALATVITNRARARRGSARSFPMFVWPLLATAAQLWFLCHLQT